jgi:23S rRNA (guanosine2251-2'-O)-methyltransferase
LSNHYLFGIHAVTEALRSDRAVDFVMTLKGAAGNRLQEIFELCRERKVPVRQEPRERLDRITNGAVHQGVVAAVAPKAYATLEAVLEDAGENALLVVLDGVEDPHNLGAIVRSAHAAGAAAIVIPERRSARLTDTVAKAAAGAVEHLPVVRGNISRALELLKLHNFWIYGLDERAEKFYDEMEYRGNTAFVLGGEGQGLHQLTAKNCDFLVRIPMAGAIASLNVSVAAGVVLFEAVRQRRRG